MRIFALLGGGASARARTRRVALPLVAKKGPVCASPRGSDPSWRTLAPRAAAYRAAVAAAPQPSTMSPRTMGSHALLLTVVEIIKPPQSLARP
jgi:hypothetical protein